MKDYVCCDIRLDSIHELLQYYEGVHAAQPVQNTFRAPLGQQYPSIRAVDTQVQAIQRQEQIYTATQELYNHKKALGDFPKSRTRRSIISIAHGNSSPLSVRVSLPIHSNVHHIIPPALSGMNIEGMLNEVIDISQFDQA